MLPKRLMLLYSSFSGGDEADRATYFSAQGDCKGIQHDIDIVTDIMVVCVLILFIFNQHTRVHMLETESFSTVFGPKAQRKKPNLKALDMEVCLK